MVQQNQLILINLLVFIHVLFVCVLGSGHQHEQVSGVRRRRNDPPPVSLCPQICECTEHKAASLASSKTAGDAAGPNLAIEQLESPATSKNNKSSTAAAISKGSSEILKNGIRVKCQSASILKTVQKLDLPHLLVENTVQLDLSGNLLAKLGVDDFSSGSYSMLQKLVLKNNQLQDISPKALQPLEHLKYLDLSNNKLTRLLPEAIAGLSSLERVKLNGNPIKCDCNLAGLLVKAAAMNVKLQGACQEPPWLKERQLARLSVQDLGCDGGAAKSNAKDASAIELKPATNQIVFEGDPFKLVCSVTSSSGSVRVSWQHQTSANETARPVTSAADKGSRVRVNETRNSSSGDGDTGNNTVVDSWLQISHLDKTNDDGWWSCSSSSSSSASSAAAKSVLVTVLSVNTPTCPSQVTVSNKGRFVWPRTMAALKIQLPCPANGHVSATRACASTGQWTDADVTPCAFVNEVTKVLEQFAKTNLVNYNEQTFFSPLNSFVRYLSHFYTFMRNLHLMMIFCKLEIS